jgi:dienelactone hydrolase
MFRIFALLLLAVPSLLLADNPTRLFPDDKMPEDRRLRTIRTLNDKDFFLRPPATKAAWETRRQAVREQLLVSMGLWPMPEFAPLKPVIHGRIDREGYSIEKVFFASIAGHYVSGSLYRPRTKDGKLPEGKLPGVLLPHGHWRDGRMYDAGEAEAKKQVAKKAESTIEGGRYPLQAQGPQLARMGCVVFHYDMVGYADSKAIAHEAFNDVAAELRLQNFMGLHTMNSLRSLDFLLSLPEVDLKRIGVTGASGGGTQTFILCGIDERPTAAFPAVMVSTQMQGGCTCENASYLRIGTGNVEFAALFAPRPMAMSGADDWTLEIERKGLPEMKAVWKLYNAEENVDAKCWPMFEHNYNQPAREMMYAWFNKHLSLGIKETIQEKPFVPVPPKELTVYTEKHPLPADSKNVSKLREWLTLDSEKKILPLLDDVQKNQTEYRRVIGTALRVMLGGGLPESREVESRTQGTPKIEGVNVRGLILGRRGQSEQIPALYIRGENFSGDIVIWIDPQGKSSVQEKGKLVSAAKALIDKGHAILAIDVLGTGELTFEKPPAVNAKFAGYTFGYNRPLVSQRVQDILSAVAFAKGQGKVKRVSLLGRGKAGPWGLLARAVGGEGIDRTAVDLNQFRFDKIGSLDDEMMLPGALKYGGMAGFVGLIAPGELLIHNHAGTGLGKGLKDAWKGHETKLTNSGEKWTEDKVVEWIVR